MLKMFLSVYASLFALSPALAEQSFKARLAGHSVLPAASFFGPPEDAPELFKTSGKITAPDRKRVEVIGSIEGTSSLSAKAAALKTGTNLPFTGQPYQGFSGIKAARDGAFWAIIDNGFGAKANSANAMLSLHLLKPDWAAGKTEVKSSIFLSDPNRNVPFQIAIEGSKERYLTGADFDVESFQLIGSSSWIGDELGPYLIETDKTGRVLAVFQSTKADKIFMFGNGVHLP
jgi:hypothetical protein